MDTRMDRERFTEEIWAMRAGLLRMAMSMISPRQDAEDAVQDAILTAWEKLDSLRDEKKFRAWMLRIVINTCRTALRKKKRVVLREEIERTDAEDREEQDELWQSVCALDERMRLPIVLHYYEGFSVAQIARIMGRPKGTIAIRMKRGRDILRRELSGEEGRV
ncbi:MAG: sigma-70 family RNA polymerase sigma factor [Clostridia bacterium]|nr:sigma-70 family RNA polymerase sigma factor [Clostridia bacterium]